jgi:hypothetical protein
VPATEKPVLCSRTIDWVIITLMGAPFGAHRALIGGGPKGAIAGRPQSCHVVHNNSFKTLAKSGGDVYEKGKGGWHQGTSKHCAQSIGQYLTPCAGRFLGRNPSCAQTIQCICGPQMDSHCHQMFVSRCNCSPQTTS